MIIVIVIIIRKKITISNFCQACIMKAGLTVQVEADGIYIYGILVREKLYIMYLYINFKSHSA